ASSTTKLPHFRGRELDRAEAERFQGWNFTLQEDGKTAAVLERQAVDGLRFAMGAEALDFTQADVQSAPGRHRMELGVAAGEQQSLAVIGLDDRLGLGRRLAIVTGRVQEQQMDFFWR